MHSVIHSLAPLSTYTMVNTFMYSLIHLLVLLPTPSLVRVLDSCTRLYSISANSFTSSSIQSYTPPHTSLLILHAFAGTRPHSGTTTVLIMQRITTKDIVLGDLGLLSKRSAGGIHDKFLSVMFFFVMRAATIDCVHASANFKA